MNVFRTQGIVIQALAASCFFLGLIFPTLAVSLTQEEAARKLESMTWYTEEYPPYNFAGKDGVPTGMAVDILIAAFKKIGVGLSASDSKILPWNRSYKYLLNNPGTALFSMTYTPERKKIMKFVGPTVPLSISVIAPKKSKMMIYKPADLNQLKIGVVKDDIGDQLIQKLLIRKDVLRRMVSVEQLFTLLESGKVDAVAYSVDVFKNTIKKAGEDPGQYEEVHLLRKGQSGYAFHNSTDPAVLAYLQQAIDELKADGTIDEIIARYSN